MDDKRLRSLCEFEDIIKYKFSDIKLLNTALTHSSYVHSHDSNYQYNERLEFLGDSVLSMIISFYLFNNLKDMSEGQMTRIRANIVCEKSLFITARNIKIGEYIFLSKGEENTGGRKRASILADAVEALIAAIYLDGGIQRAEVFVLSFMKDIIESSIKNRIFNDYKSFLQEHVQKNNLGTIEYRLLSEKGPDHSKEFQIALYLDDKPVGQGVGKSKKDAQQSAAKAAMSSLGIKNE
ncbi:Ribonuclease 3 [bioreactor metagenome]|uniref:ribonuclease III n=1 Tax=bioreactor metagenome TaxID=1076179 RepID=A0A645CXP5_9ZZZZ|nr:ribonuclease III [Lutispora sp.]MEA4960112.1 ribonuclease III [Lutispora sp.]